jgi:hypothetical protein
MCATAGHVFLSWLSGNGPYVSGANRQLSGRRPDVRPTRPHSTPTNVQESRPVTPPRSASPSEGVSDLPCRRAREMLAPEGCGSVAGSHAPSRRTAGQTAPDASASASAGASERELDLERRAWTSSLTCVSQTRITRLVSARSRTAAGLAASSVARSKQQRPLAGVALVLRAPATRRSARILAERGPRPEVHANRRCTRRARDAADRAAFRAFATAGKAGPSRNPAKPANLQAVQ